MAEFIASFAALWKLDRTLNSLKIGKLSAEAVARVWPVAEGESCGDKGGNGAYT